MAPPAAARRRVAKLQMELIVGIVSAEMKPAEKAGVGAGRPDKAAVLSKAVLRAAEILQIRQNELAEILGVSAPTVTRLAAGDKKLLEGRSEYQLAALFVRLFRSLDTLVGGSAEQARLWLRAYNDHLNGVPLELAKSVRGLVNVADYLDAVRGAP
jgi:transcriptional regulator with XRE-family HTH domain